MLTVPKADVGFNKTMAKKMGWTIERKQTKKPRLYDPETGDYLNDATMKVIEDARKGKNVIEVGFLGETVASAKETVGFLRRKPMVFKEGNRWLWLLFVFWRFGKKHIAFS